MTGAVTRPIGAAASVPPVAAAPAARFNPKYLPLAATISLFVAMASWIGAALAWLAGQD